MLIKILGFLSIKWAIFYGNHVSGMHMSGEWLNDLKRK